MRQYKDGFEGSLKELAVDAITGKATWHGFLDCARNLMPNGQAVLFYHDATSGTGAFPLIAGADEDTPAEYEAYYASINPWMPHATVRPLCKVVQSDEMLARRQLEKTEYYADFLKPRDVRTGFGVTIVRDGGCNFLFSVVGADIDEVAASRVKSTLQSVVPHLRKAFEHYRKNPHWLAAADASRRSSFRLQGLVRLTAGAKVVEADEEAIRIADQTSWLTLERFGRFNSASKALAEHVEAVLASWYSGRVPPDIRVFHLPRDNARMPLRITAYTAAGGGASYFRGPECVLVLEDPSASIAPAAAQFASFFGLSGAEQRVVEGIASGFSLEAVASLNGTSIHTVRTQLKHVFAKSGLSRQSEIASHVAMMAGGISFENGPKT